MIYSNSIRLERQVHGAQCYLVMAMNDDDDLCGSISIWKVVNSTRWLLRRAFNVLLEGVPDSIDLECLRIRLSDIEGMSN